MPDARILVIGGPTEANLSLPRVDRIGADLVSILGGAPRPFHDYDFVVYWPGMSGSALAKSHAQWLAYRERHEEALPDIPLKLWKQLGRNTESDEIEKILARIQADGL